MGELSEADLDTIEADAIECSGSLYYYPTKEVCSLIAELRRCRAAFIQVSGERDELAKRVTELTAPGPYYEKHQGYRRCVYCHAWEDRQHEAGCPWSSD